MKTKVDRVLIDILDWIRRVIWFDRGKVTQRPYIVVETLVSRRGKLKRLIRDTHRAVRTWEFQPYKKHGHPKPWTVRICCDFNELTPRDDRVPKGKVQPKKRATSSRYSHQFRVLLVNPDFNETEDYYEYEVLFDGVFDWQVRSSHRDEYAILITDCVSKQLLTVPIRQINWQHELKACAQTRMGGHYNGIHQLYTAQDSVVGILIDPEPIDPAELLKKTRKDKDFV